MKGTGRMDKEYIEIYRNNGKTAMLSGLSIALCARILGDNPEDIKNYLDSRLAYALELKTQTSMWSRICAWLNRFRLSIAKGR
jgi:hypothetical protein